MRRPAIPDVPNSLSPEQQRLLSAMKERLEQISGERRSSIDLLDASATDADIIAKVNELLGLLQG